MFLTLTTTTRAGDRPRLPAAQAPGPGAGVRACRSARRTCSTPRRPTSAARSRCCSRSTRSPWCAGGAAAGDGLRAGAVRQRPAVRRVVDARRRAGQGLPHRDGRPLQRPAGAGGPAAAARDAAARRCPAAAAPTWSRDLFAPLGWHGRRDRRCRSTRGPRVGRLAATSTCASPARCRLARRAQPPLRAAAGARRRQALLGRRGRGRQADPRRRRLAADAPGARPRSPAATSPPAAPRRRRDGPAGRARRPEPERWTRRRGPRRADAAGRSSRCAARRSLDRAAGRAARTASSTSAAARARCCATCSPTRVHRGPRRRCLPARAGGRRATPRTRPAAGPAARPAQAAPVLADLPRRPAGRLRRRRADGGRRARRPAACRRSSSTVFGARRARGRSW